MFDSDFFGFGGMPSSFRAPARPRGYGGYAPHYQAPAKPRYAPSYYDDDDDDYEQDYYAPRQPQPRSPTRRVQPREEPELPELELEEYPGKGWIATAQLGRGLNSNNVKLQLVDDEDEPYFLINALVTRPATYYTRATTTQTPIARCPIPSEGDASQASAVIKNGVLNLLIPRKKQQRRPQPVQHVPINRVQKTKPAPVEAEKPKLKSSATRIPVKPGSPTQSPPSTIKTQPEAANPPSPITARRLQIQKEEEDVFERALKYAVPE